MPPYIIYTIQITADNVDQIEAAALTQDWYLDHLKDNLKMHESREKGFRALVIYITVIKTTGQIISCNDVPFFNDEHTVMDHIDLQTLLNLIKK